MFRKFDCSSISEIWQHYRTGRGSDWNVQSLQSKIRVLNSYLGIQLRTDTFTCRWIQYNSENDVESQFTLGYTWS